MTKETGRTPTTTRRYPIRSSSKAWMKSSRNQKRGRTHSHAREKEMTSLRKRIKLFCRIRCQMRSISTKRQIWLVITYYSCLKVYPNKPSGIRILATLRQRFTSWKTQKIRSRLSTRQEAPKINSNDSSLTRTSKTISWAQPTNQVSRSTNWYFHRTILNWEWRAMWIRRPHSQRTWRRAQ